MDFDYDIALSFAGEDRGVVELIAAELKSRGVTVFYDRYEVANLWGRDLYVHLDEVYRKRARYCLMFLSKSYASKLWTTHERRSAQARAITEKGEYLLPIRLDDTEIPGILSTVGYIKTADFSAGQIAELVAQKLREANDSRPPAGATVGLFMDTQYLIHASGGLSVDTIGRSLLAFAESMGPLGCAWATAELAGPRGAAIGDQLTNLGFSLATSRKRGQADLALLERITEETIRRRAKTFVLATGDGDFIEKVMGLLVLGHPVHLVARTQRLFAGFANLATDRRKTRLAAGLSTGDFVVHELGEVLDASGNAPWQAIAEAGYPEDGFVVEVQGAELLLGQEHPFVNRAMRVTGVWRGIDGDSVYPDGHFTITHWRRVAESHERS